MIWHLSNWESSLSVIISDYCQYLYLNWAFIEISPVSEFFWSKSNRVERRILFKLPGKQPLKKPYAEETKTNAASASRNTFVGIEIICKCNVALFDQCNSKFDAEGDKSPTLVWKAAFSNKCFVIHMEGHVEVEMVIVHLFITLDIRYPFNGVICCI